MGNLPKTMRARRRNLTESLMVKKSANSSKFKESNVFRKILLGLSMSGLGAIGLLYVRLYGDNPTGAQLGPASIICIVTGILILLLPKG